MTAEISKEYVSVNEKEFWKEKTLKVNREYISPAMESIVLNKVRDLNAKLDAKYDVALMDSWSEKIWSAEKTKLVSELKEVIKWFNQEIATLEEKYIGETAKNQAVIQADISGYFSDKTLFVEEGGKFTLADVLISGANGKPMDLTQTHHAKELSLN